jgi:hypothetical protein
MSDDLSTLANTLLANFVTVRFPRNEPLWTILDEDLALDLRVGCLCHALRGELLSVGCHRHCLRLALRREGHCQFLDHVEADPTGGWRIHLFLIDADAIPLVASITEGRVGRGDPVSFDPPAFIERRVTRLEKFRRLTGRCSWLDDDLP